MANTVGSLQINLIANLKPLAAGLQRAGAKLGAFARSVANVGRVVLGAGLAVAGAALAGIVAQTTKSIAVMDEFGDVATQTGFSFEKIFKAQTALAKRGVNGQQVLLRIAEAAKDAATRGGQASRVFAELGLNAREIMNADADEALLRIVEAARRINQVIPGKGDTLLRDLGVGDLVKAQDDLLRTDILAAVTPSSEQVARIKEFTAAWSDATQAMTAAGAAVGSLVSPALTAIAGTVQETAEALKFLAETVEGLTAKQIKKIVAEPAMNFLNNSLNNNPISRAGAAADRFIGRAESVMGASPSTVQLSARAEALLQSIEQNTRTEPGAL